MSESSRFKFGKLTWRVRVKKFLDLSDIETPSHVYSGFDFYKDFMDASYGAPWKNPTSMDMGIIKNLLTKHDRDHLLRCARVFWSRYSEPYYTKPDTKLMRLFSSLISTIEKEL